MRHARATLTRIAVGILIAVLVVGSVPVTVTAQSTTGLGGTMVVDDGETVDELSGVAGTMIVREGGTVTGDVSGLAGNVYVHGTVEGDVDVVAGNVEITGTVEGDVASGSGNLVVAEGATIGGSIDAGAGNVRIDGAVEGDVAVGAETVRLGDAASIGGDMRYDGTLEGNEAAVAGDLTRDSSLAVQVAPTLQPIASWVFSIYALVLNLLLGAILLGLFPRFSEDVARRVSSDPVRTGLAGLFVLVAIPLLLIGTAITVIGIPLSFVGAIVFALVAWSGVVYGRFAVAAWALSYADVDNPWVALVVGLVGGAVLAQIPYLGALGNLLIFLLGLGALSAGLYSRRRQGGVSPSDTGSDEAVAG